jgi:hypothetical protein
MKKLLEIVALGLLLNGNAFSKTISSYEDLDLTSKPKKVLSKSKTKFLWNAYKKAPKCFEHPTYENGVGYKLKKKSTDNFVVKSIKEPSKTNSIYVISCPDGGDRLGTIEQPSTYFIEIATNTMVYANKFPEYANSDFIIKKYRGTFNNKYQDQLLKSEPSELFTLHPMLITK